MHLDRDGDLISTLFAAVTAAEDDRAAGGHQSDGPSGWLAFLEVLRCALQADSSGLHLTIPDRAVMFWHRGGLVAPAAEALRAMRVARVYSQIDLPGGAPADPPIRALRVGVGAGPGPQGQAVLIVRRAARDFRALDASRLSGLVPWLGQAVSAWLALRDARARAATDHAICGALGVGWLSLHPSGTVRAVDTNARALIDASEGLRLGAGGHLSFADEAMALRFRQALGTVSGTASTLVLEPAPFLSLSVMVHPRRGDGTILVQLRRVPRARDLPTARWAEALALSPSQARLAVLICDGFSLRDAARWLGWTIETARSCSKAIYAQAGVSGQTGLVRKMMSSAIWLA